MISHHLAASPCPLDHASRPQVNDLVGTSFFLTCEFLSHRRLLFFWELAPSAPIHTSYPLCPEHNKSHRLFYFPNSVGKSLLTVLPLLLRPATAALRSVNLLLCSSPALTRRLCNLCVFASLWPQILLQTHYWLKFAKVSQNSLSASLAQIRQDTPTASLG
jgi:hypothetical protein